LVLYVEVCGGLVFGFLHGGRVQEEGRREIRNENERGAKGEGDRDGE
jgi:hypothetical protein